jgi:N,N'-diacetyllegionaminate synthase
MKTRVIAEIGINHDGKIDKAIKLINEAKKTGADIVKFQIFEPNLLATGYANKAKYQKQSKLDVEKQVEMLKKYTLTHKEHTRLFNHCKKINIIYSASAFDLKSAKFLMSLKPLIIKIPSGEITNFPLIKCLSKFNGELILSTGMSNLKEVSDCLHLIKKNGFNKKNLTLLYCCSSYPTPIEDIDINIMKNLQKKFSLNVGISDHSNIFESTFAAVACGATVVEKHFTLDKNDMGPDHKASFDIKQFSKMIKNIKLINSIFKSGDKIVKKSELETRKISRKSIVAKKNILKGELFTEKNLTTKRPGTGITPMKWEKIIGKRSKKYFKKDDQIN